MTDALVALRAFLISEPAIAARVDTRVYPLMLPQRPRLPAITTTRVSAGGSHTTERRSDIDGPRIQIDSWAETYDEAFALADAIRDRLDGYRGPAGDVTIAGAFLADRRDFHEDAPECWRVSQDYFVWFR